MKLLLQALLGIALISTNPAFSANSAPATPAAAPDAVHLRAVQDLLGAIQVEKVLRGVAGRSHYQSDAQRQAVFARIDKVAPAEVYQRLAAPLASVISTDTAIEMTRFYNTPYGKQVLHKRYNSSPQMIIPGMPAPREIVSPEEKKERKRTAYVHASKELADAEPAIEHEAFKLLQQIVKDKR